MTATTPNNINPSILYDNYPPYLRRCSPPGGPTTTTQQSFSCCTKKKTTTNTILTTLLVLCLIFGYLLMGAFVFMFVENNETTTTMAIAQQSNLANNNNIVVDLRTETVDRLWSITENLNILYRENWTKLATEEVLIFQKELFKILTKTNYIYKQEINYQQFNNKQMKWTFHSSFFYSLTLITTIGYGSITPKTILGKLITIFYALIGIPLMLLYLSIMGDWLATIFRFLYKKICCNYNNNKQMPSLSVIKANCQCNGQLVTKKTNNNNNKRIRETNIPIVLCFTIVIVYLCFGIFLFKYYQNWTILDSFYFCFTCLSTIGFGDLLKSKQQQTTDKRNEEFTLYLCSMYILIGMAVISMCFNLIQMEIVTLFKYLNMTCTKNTLKMTDS